MNTKHLRLLLNCYWAYSKKNQTSGFTLIELLVALIISTVIILALLSLVVDILQMNSRENARDQTQQEMQTALNYITAELREALYVYDNKCLTTTAQGTAPTASIGATVNYCPGLQNYLPASFTTSTQKPVLAFWKPETIPDSDLAGLGDCSTVTTGKEQECKDLITKRRTYTLVVYLQSTDNSSVPPTWTGKSRIRRYALSKYNYANINELKTFTLSTGYVDPYGTDSTSFQMWPRKTSDGTNLQASLPSTSGVNPAALVDFVDAPDATPPATLPLCNAGYIRSPESGTSFFACVRTAVGTTGEIAQTGINQDVVLYLRGNANGKSGVTSNNFRPVLQSQVLMRGVIDKIPQ
ncbi:prepilin-type N-terminal cleavage/methylation domain-containing protein [Nostoc sp. HG1]|nr:prepilin-type N-terminal cleavage/methylation domain-containing protein [Nostoc sp. HG1]